MLLYKDTHPRVVEMIKKILSLFIFASFGLLIFTIINPNITSRGTDQLLDFFNANKDNSEGLVVSNPKNNNIIDTPVDPLEKSGQIAQILSYFRGESEPTKGQLNYSAVIEYTNKERIKAGISPLAVNVKLGESAKLKTNDMIINQYFEHTSPTGVSVSDLGKKVGYDYVIMGENLALGEFATDEELVQAWMNSPGHRENILNKTYKEIGVYVAKGFYKNKEVWFAVQHFGTSRSICPSISSSLKNEIDVMNTDLKKRGDEIAVLRIELEKSILNSDEYLKKVSAFNILVSQYNQLLLESQQNIKEYNLQIVAFNNCLVVYQK